jgi:hypothetical protein
MGRPRLASAKGRDMVWALAKVRAGYCGQTTENRAVLTKQLDKALILCEDAMRV